MTTRQDDAAEVLSFARALLRAFHEAERFAEEQGGISPDRLTVSHTIFRSFYSATRTPTSLLTSAKSHKQLQGLFNRCIRQSVDDICEALQPASKGSANRARRIQTALSLSDADVKLILTPTTPALVSILDDIANSFREQHGSLGRSPSNQGWVSDWNPDWRTQNLVWSLLKKLGTTSPPSGPLTSSFQGLKESAFACLFKGDYLAHIRRKCTFKHSLLRYIPTPGKWDADMTWIGTAAFISLPTASLVHSWRDGNRLAAFWSTFVSLFVGVSAALLILFASYRSSYSNSLLDKAARGTPHERERGEGLFSVVSMLPSVAVSPTRRSSIGSSPSRVASVTRDTQSTVTVQTTADITDTDNDTTAGQTVALTESKSDGRTASVLRLYQASMLVERIYGSTYMDESWMLGMTEQQLYDAVLLVLQTAGALGRQTAAFSFTSLAIATRGVPDPEKIGARPISAAVQGVQVSFATFSFLGALAFSCGMMSAMISDLILRQMAFTQVKHEGTMHAFVEKFAFFIRATGGLNSCAAMSLFTGVMVFLLSIFQVHPIAVIPFGAAWLVLGTLLIESFFTKFHFWNMAEIIHDASSFIDDPDITSPSPVAGTIQHAVRFGRRMISRLKRKQSRPK